MQFLYCTDLEGGADPCAMREAFWDFVTESDRRKLLIACLRTIHHLAQGRDSRLHEWIERQQAARPLLAGLSEADGLRNLLDSIARRESQWSAALAGLERISPEDDSAATLQHLQQQLDQLFALDHELCREREELLEAIESLARLKGRLEALAASTRRMQRISERLRMVENPESFPDQADIANLRQSRTHLRQLRESADQMVDRILAEKTQLDASIAAVVENYDPGRIDPVDRAILRLAACEIRTGMTPSKVAINEAIELARRYGTSDSWRFVNGVLDPLARAAGAT